MEGKFRSLDRNQTKCFFNNEQPAFNDIPEYDWIDGQFNVGGDDPYVDPELDSMERFRCTDDGGSLYFSRVKQNSPGILSTSPFVNHR